MKPKVLLRILQWSLSIAMLFYITSVLFNVYMNTIWDKSPQESTLPEYKLNYNLRKMATIYKEDGIQIPVTMHFWYPDTIVQYAGQLNTVAKAAESWIFSQNDVDNRFWYNSWSHSLEDWQQATVQKYDTVYQVDTLITKALVAENGSHDLYWLGEKVEERYQENVFDLASLQPKINSWVSIKPKHEVHFAIMLIKDNLPSLFYIFILYHLMLTVKQLKTQFAVSKKLYCKIRLIGLAIIGYTILQFVLDYWLKSLYSFISIEKYSTSINQIDGLHLYMSGYLGFNFHIFIAGVLLIILSTLMKRSSKIEDAWALTI